MPRRRNPFVDDMAGADDEDKCEDDDDEANEDAENDSEEGDIDDLDITQVVKKDLKNTKGYIAGLSITRFRVDIH